jgi:uncharacterized YccA/Bax inhibitor family protein
MSSPLFSGKVFDSARSTSYEGSMTVSGTINKSILLFATLLVPAFWVWNKMSGVADMAAEDRMSYAINNGVQGYMIGGLIIGFISILIMMFKKSWSPYLAPIYAAAEGVLLGSISMFFELMYPGIVIQAVGITLLIFAIMLMAYRSGLLRATPVFTKVLMFATMGVGAFYLIMMVMNLFGAHSLSNFYAGSSLLSIGISALVAGIAAFNLILDFTFIEQQAEQGAPKYMEWFASVGLLATLIWLYLEILRLLSKLQSRD